MFDVFSILLYVGKIAFETIVGQTWQSIIWFYMAESVDVCK